MTVRTWLSQDTLLRIPELLLLGCTQRQIAAELGVSQPTIGRILRGQDMERLWPELVRQLAQAREELLNRHRCKKCTKCGKTFPRTPEYFGASSRKCGIGSTCLTCKNAAQRDRYKKVRSEALIYYSGGQPRCGCCGEPRDEFLTIDHINGGGAKHRADEVQGKYASISLYLKANRFPPGYRVLCMNCNTAIWFHGRCPHQRSGITTRC